MMNIWPFETEKELPPEGRRLKFVVNDEVGLATPIGGGNRIYEKGDSWWGRVLVWLHRRRNYLYFEEMDNPWEISEQAATQCMNCKLMVAAPDLYKSPFTTYQYGTTNHTAACLYRPNPVPGNGPGGVGEKIREEVKKTQEGLNSISWVSNKQYLELCSDKAPNTE